MTFDFKPALRMKRSAFEDIGREYRIVQIGEHYSIADKGTVRHGKSDLKSMATETV